MSSNKQIDPNALGFLELTGATGSALWVVAGSVYAIERDPNEKSTLVKTASELFAVADAPAGVFEQFAAVQRAQADPQAKLQARLDGEQSMVDALRSLGLAYVTADEEPVVVSRMAREDAPGPRLADFVAADVHSPRPDASSLLRGAQGRPSDVAAAMIEGLYDDDEDGEE